MQCNAHANILLQPCNPYRKARTAAPSGTQHAAYSARRQRHHAQCVRAEPSSRPDEEDAAAPSSTSSVPDYLPSGDLDWRDFRARLVASGRHDDAAADMWAHHVPVPEQGCLLVAHPLMFASAQEYFFQSVILVFAHDAAGSAGLILNRPTEHQISQINGTGFGNMMLYLGGDVGQDTFHLLHPYDLPSSREIMKGVHLGGFEAAKAGLEAGELAEANFKGPGQLARECKAGVWLTAAASGSFVLQHDKDGAAMWHQALELMGGEFAGLSQAMKGETLPGLEPPPEQDSS